MIGIITAIAVENIGIEKTKELIIQLKEIITKINDDDIIIITRISGNASLIKDNKKNCEIEFKKAPEIINVESSLNEISENLKNNG